MSEQLAELAREARIRLVEQVGEPIAEFLECLETDWLLYGSTQPRTMSLFYDLTSAERKLAIRILVVG